MVEKSTDLVSLLEKSLGGKPTEKLDEIGTVKFTETKSNTNLKFTFAKTHPGTTNEQYLWIREIKFSPVIN